MHFEPHVRWKACHSVFVSICMLWAYFFFPSNHSILLNACFNQWNSFCMSVSGCVGFIFFSFSLHSLISKFESIDREEQKEMYERFIHCHFSFRSVYYNIQLENLLLFNFLILWLFYYKYFDLFVCGCLHAIAPIKLCICSCCANSYLGCFWTLFFLPFFNMDEEKNQRIVNTSCKI